MDNEILNFLMKRDNYYLGHNNEIEIKGVGEFREDDLVLYNIEKMVIGELEDRKRAIENILNSMKIDGINFLNLVIGDEDGGNFYFGVAKDLYYDGEMKMGIADIGNCLLEPNIKGNFHDSKITELDLEEKKKIEEFMDGMEYFSVLEGSPGKKGKTENYMDRLLNIMGGEKFGFMIVSKPLNDDEIWNIENNLNQLYTSISSLSINNVQESVSNSVTYSIANSAGESFTNVFSGLLSVQGSISENKGGNTDTSVSKTKEESEAGKNNSSNISKKSANNDNSSNKSVMTTSNSSQEGTSIGENWGKTIGKNISIDGGYSRSNTTDSSITQVEAVTEGTSTTANIQSVNTEARSWINYMDDVLFPRLDYGKGKGLFNVSTFLFADKNVSLKKLEGIIKLIFVGDSGNKVPIKSIDLNTNNIKKEIYKKFQLPHGNFKENKGGNNPLARAAITQYLDERGNLILGNWVSSKELSLAMIPPDEELEGVNYSKARQLVINILNNIEGEEMEYLIKILKRLFEKK